MKEILFKALTKERKWVEGDFAHNVLTDKGDAYVYSVIQSIEVNETTGKITLHENAINEKTLCQYTGLIDKNGNKAFSNDVVKDSKGNIFVIQAEQGGFVIMSEKEHKENNPIIQIYHCLAEHQVRAWFMQNCEIIGNIHDKEESNDK